MINTRMVEGLKFERVSEFYLDSNNNLRPRIDPTYSVNSPVVYINYYEDIIISIGSCEHNLRKRLNNYCNNFSGKMKYEVVRTYIRDILKGNTSADVCTFICTSIKPIKITSELTVNPYVSIQHQLIKQLNPVFSK